MDNGQVLNNHIINDLEKVMDKVPKAKMYHDLLLKLDTARMELEASPPCMDYTCVCLESVKEAVLLINVLQAYAYFYTPMWMEESEYDE